MKEQNGSEERLASWKEIAAFLGVDERTCQRWEKRYGLPVRRLEDAAKSRVYSTKSDLARWRETAFRNGTPPEEKAALGAAVKDAVAPAAKPRPRRKIGSLHVLIGLGLLTVVILSFTLPDRQPVDFGIEPPFFIAKNKHGRELWRFDTKVDLAPESAARKTFQVAQPSSSQNGVEAKTQASLIISDLDGDGRNETLYSPLSKEDKDICRIILLNRRGKRIEQFEMGRPVWADGTLFPPESVIGGLQVADVNADGAMEIIALSHTRMESPTRLVVLDLKLRLLGEYWHFGQISDFKVEDLDGDDRPEIICCGQYRGPQEGPCFFILDPNRLGGAAPHPSSKGMFPEMDPGTERLYIALPLTPLEALKAPGVAALRLDILKSGSIWVHIDVDGASYHFDFQGRLQSIVLGDNFERTYQTAVKSGLLPRLPDYARLNDDLAAGIRYYDGRTKSWVDRWALSNPR